MQGELVFHFVALLTCIKDSRENLSQPYMLNTAAYMDASFHDRARHQVKFIYNDK